MTTIRFIYATNSFTSMAQWRLPRIFYCGAACMHVCVCVARSRNIWMILAPPLHCVVLCLHRVHGPEDVGLMAAFIGRVMSSYESLDRAVRANGCRKQRQSRLISGWFLRPFIF